MATGEIYVANAGLVILAPYFSLFFKNMQLLTENKFNNVPRAIALLHYLIYGDDDYEEFQCVLSKIICGLELSTVIYKYTLYEADKSEADALLQAVIAHWQVLKNTSPDGLRNSFLQREGRLVFIDHEWQLVVQKESPDILLAHLPWNISLIKLPWMKNLLKVDWI